MKTLPAHVEIIDTFLTDRLDARATTFTVRELATWHVDRTHKSMPLRGRSRQRAINQEVARLSQWLQRYWQDQARERYVFGIDCVGFGPGAHWVFEEAIHDGTEAATRLRNRLHKAIEVQFSNGVRRSVVPWLTTEQVAHLDDELGAAVEMMTEAAMRLVLDGQLA